MKDNITGEWTADKVLMMGVNDAATAYNIADAHNAALSAEENKRADWNVVIEDLEKQLAAERERSKELSEDLEHYSEIIDKREKQLAAEREKVQQMSDMLKSIRDTARKTDWDLARRIDQVL